MNTTKSNNYDTATLAGGCFWCTEAVFKRLKGVVRVMPGYSGGSIENPTYEQICEGNTGHAEAIQIKFDPKIISYEKLLDVFWYLHDPTTLNRQGADVGTQYRSAIFYHNDQQKETAINSKNLIEKSGTYKSKIVTQIVPFTNFYPAEKYHEDYYQKNPESMYCKIVIDPKIKKLLRDFKEDVII